MKNYTVRNAAPEDMQRILEIYAIAREFMAQTGNPTQWGNTYPEEALLWEDIRKHSLYVVTQGSQIRGVFYFSLGNDPTYGYMEQGSWRSDTPYGTIHRIAGDGSGGIFRACLAHVKQFSKHIRIDTHRDNMPMQHVVEKNGFSRRGIIYVADGSPRIAYDLI